MDQPNIRVGYVLISQMSLIALFAHHAVVPVTLQRIVAANVPDKGVHHQQILKLRLMRNI